MAEKINSSTDEFYALSLQEQNELKNILSDVNLPFTFNGYPLVRTTRLAWQVLDLGNYDGQVEGISAAELYYRTAHEAGALPLNQWIEWPGMANAIDQVLGGKSKVPLSVFEVGGGDGRQMQEMLSKYPEIGNAVFIEKSQQMIDMAKQKLPGWNVRYYLSSAESGLGLLEKAQYDLGIGSLMMHYLEPWQLALFYLRLKNVLKSDGVYLFSGGTPEFNLRLARELHGDELPKESDIRRLSWYMFDTKLKPVFEMKANLYFPKDHESLAFRIGLDFKGEAMKPQLPATVESEKLSEQLQQLLNSPVWYLYTLRNK